MPLPDSATLLWMFPLCVHARSASVRYCSQACPRSNTDHWEVDACCQVVKLLVHAGANFHARDGMGNLACDYCKGSIVKMLSDLAPMVVKSCVGGNFDGLCSVCGRPPRSVPSPPDAHASCGIPWLCGGSRNAELISRLMMEVLDRTTRTACSRDQPRQGKRANGHERVS